MNSKFLRICSMILTIVMLFNMLPAQALGEMIFTEKQSVSATDETLSANATVESSADDEPAYIVDEIKERRTEHSKDFRLSNGLQLAVVYDNPVHYKNNGEWEEIDNTLMATTDGTYTNTAGVWEVALPQQMTANSPVTIAKDGYTLSFVLSGQLTKPSDAVVMSKQAELIAQANISAGNAEDISQTFALTSTQTATAQQQDVGIAELKATAEHPETISDKLASRLLYENIYSDTSITYDLDSNKVKESIIMEQHNANLRGYKYTLNVGTMVPVLYDDGRIEFFNEDKTEVVMVMPAPFLIDAGYAYSEDIDVQLTGKGSTYTLTYILPQSWLADEERQWPVILDPVVSAGNANSNIQDQEIAEFTQVSHTRGVMEAGYGANGGIERFFIQYAELPQFTSADVIVYAQVSLMKPNNYPTSAVIEVHEVYEEWDSSTLHWSNKPDYNPIIEDYRVVEDAGNYTWDITNIVRGWYEGTNTGMMFKASDEVEEAQEVKWMQFYSSDCGFSSGRPALQIQYENHNGYEDYWSYTSASAGRAGTGYVNNYTGNLVWMHDDIGFDGNRQPVSISHAYNTNDIGNTDRYGTSPGWKTSMNQRIYPYTDDNDTDYYIWEDEDGTAHYMKKEYRGYVDVNDPSIVFNIKATSSTYYFRLDIGNGNRYHFDSMWRLTKIEDFQRTSNSIKITYGATNTYKISTVTDGAGRLYTYNYNDDGLLSHISYTGTGTTEIARVSFEYEAGILKYITDIDGHKVEFRYDGNLLIEAVDLKKDEATGSYMDGHKLLYSYSGNPSRVSEIKEYDGTTAGGHMSIEYGHNQTVLRDEVNKINQITRFNDWGNVVTVQDELGRAQHVGYTKMSKDDTGAGGQLTLSSKLQNTVNNLLSDHSFESGSAWTGGEVTEEFSYLGSKSLDVGETAYGESIYLAPGESVTLSAFAKTQDSTATVLLIVGDEEISGTTIGKQADWKRCEVSYTNNSQNTQSVQPAVHVIDGSSDGAYFDCVQLEKMAAASRYNLLENSDFSNNSANWTGDGFEVKVVTSEDPAIAATAAPHLDNNVLYVAGNPEGEKRISQTLSIDGEKGDTFVLAGWAKGDSAPLIEEGENQRSFGVELTFNYTTEVDEPKDKQIVFNTDTDNIIAWQYAATPIVAEEAYDSVTVTITYDYNVNSALFDGVQLFKETFGNSYTYDENGNVTSVVNLQQQKTAYEYTSNDLTKTVLPTGAEMIYTYDDYHNVKTATTAEGQNYKFEYDTYGNNTRVSMVSDSQIISSSATYTANGNFMASVTDNLNKTTTYGYDPNTSVLLWVQSPNETSDTRIEYTYDENTFLLTNTSKAISSSTNPDLKMSAGYTYENNQVKMITTPTTTYAFEYGPFGQRNSVQIGTGINALILTRYTYDEDTHSLLSLDYGNGDELQYEYDKYGRLSKQTYVDYNAAEGEANDTVTYLYDNDGEVAAIIDSASGITTRKYFDLSGRYTGYSETAGGYSHTVGYEYDDINNLTKLVDSINGAERTTSYIYDKDNRAVSITTDGITVDYTYDNLGRVTQQVTKNGESVIMTEVFEFSAPTASTTSSQVKSYKTYKGAISDKNLIAEYAYTYDDNGNILTISDGTNVTKYTYDSANQLVREDNQQNNKSYTWTYDNAGNILSHNIYAYSTGNLEAPTSDPVTYTYSDALWGDLLIAWNGQTITYEDGETEDDNNIGNPEQIGDRHFTWEHGRQLASLTEGTTTWNYTYNSNGLRTGRTNGTTAYNYVYSGSTLTQMTVGAQVVTFTYDASGIPLTMKLDGTIYYYLTNQQGDVMGLMDSSGTVVVSYAYSAFGKITITSRANAAVAALNPLTYRGYVYDAETGLYYLQSRYYDPEIGRFINADSVVAGTGGTLLGHNMFAYCLNNPVNTSDSAGNWPRWATIALGAVAAVAAVAVTVATLGAAAPAAACTLTMVGMSMGASYAVASTVAAGAVVATTVAAAAYAGDIAYSSVTGDSILLDTVFQGDTEAYNAGLAVTSFATGGMLEAAAHSPGACFVAGTPVLTARGYTAIENINVGDFVWAEDPKTGEKDIKKVVRTFTNKTEELIHIFVNGEEIITTPEHPFYLPVQGWTSASELCVGDVLVMQNGEHVAVERVQHESLETSIVVYNFEVEDFHTYYIGYSAVLVHNMCEKIGRQNGNSPRSNQAQNKQFRSIVQEYQLTKDEARILHDEITGQGYSRKEIIEELLTLFPEKGR